MGGTVPRGAVPSLRLTAGNDPAWPARPSFEAVEAKSGTVRAMVPKPEGVRGTVPPFPAPRRGPATPMLPPCCRGDVGGPARRYSVRSAVSSTAMTTGKPTVASSS